MTSLTNINQQTLTDIQELQNIEKGLFNDLEIGISGTSLSQQQKDSIIQKINEVSQMRINLYKNIDNYNTAYTTNVSNARNTLADQTIAIEIVEKELNEAKKRLKLINEEKANKLRLVEINEYYTEKYNFQSKIMKTIIYACIPIIILSFLTRFGLPKVIYVGLVVIILAIAGVILIRQFISSNMRNPMNYQQYNFHFDARNAPTSTSSSNSKDPWAKPAVSCIGQQCCTNGLVFDVSLNYCVVSSNNNISSS